MNESLYPVLPKKTNYVLVDEIVNRAAPAVRQGILIGIIQDLKPELCREAFRTIVKATYASEDPQAARRLCRSLVKGFDYVSGLSTRCNMKNAPDEIIDG